jgi:hypothetical protein
MELGLLSKRGLLTLAVLLGGLILASSAAAKTASPRPLVLDAYSPALKFFTPPVSSPSKLSRKHLYVATVRGSVGFYQAVDYTAIQVPWHIMCGVPQRAPMFSSAGGSGPIGNDAEFIFALPLVGRSCAGQKLPRPYTNFQANLGHGWNHPSVLSRQRLVKPSRSHTYAFALTGAGRPVSFRLIDPDTRDDYGSFQIYLRSAVSADCAGVGHRAFGLSRKACLAATANRPAAPRLPAAPNVLAIDQSPVARVLRGSDVPTGVNQEVPSGALTVSQFATLDNPSRSAATAETQLLQGQGFRSSAITEFAGMLIPDLRSTAVELSSPQQALAALNGEVTLAVGDQGPAGTTATASPDTNLESAFIVTFTPSAGRTGGLELLASAGDYVYTLRAVGKPTVVSRQAEEQLLGEVLSRG